MLAPAPTINVTSQTACAPDTTSGGAGSVNSLITGTIAAPDFQWGGFPFLQGGGNVVIGADGRAVVQRTRTSRSRSGSRVEPPRQRAGRRSATSMPWAPVGIPNVYPPPYSYAGYVFGTIPAHFEGATEQTLTTFGVPAGVAAQPALRQLHQPGRRSGQPAPAGGQPHLPDPGARGPHR